MTYMCDYTMLGMVSKNNIIDFDKKCIYKKVDKSKVLVFDKDFDISGFSEINYAYISEKPNAKSYYRSTEVISHFAKDYFTNLRSYSREIYQTKRKWDKKIVIKTELNSIEEVIELIDKWSKNSGVKYRWQEHSGYDKTFFLKYYEVWKDKLKCFFFYLNDVLVGYSIISPRVKDTYYYIIRKMDISVGRNICEYIDYKTFELLNDNDFFVNWGASSGGVLQYKTKKFPVYKTEKRYFWKIKNEI